jgi:phytoene dehydrogenase-like protein
MFDFAVVGSGVGGSSIAALLSKKGYKVILFEKDNNLGGSSSTFSHKGHYFNAGATTLAGYNEDHVVKEIFDEIGIKPELQEYETSMVVLHGDKQTKRTRDIDTFLKNIQISYPHKQHDSFWRLVHRINKEFDSVNNYYYTNKNKFLKYRSLFSFLPFVWKFRKYLFCDAQSFIKKYYNDLDLKYQEFLEAQVFIVAQAKLKDISFFTAAIALAYTFNKNYHVVGGFKNLFSLLCQNIDTVLTNTQIVSINKELNSFSLSSTKRCYQAKNVILNTTVYQSAKLFNQSNIKQEFCQYELLNNHQGAFALYMILKTDRQLEHHYQIITDDFLPHSLSQSIFVSTSNDLNDGYMTITASTHSDERIWYNTAYKENKHHLQNSIRSIIKEKLFLNENEIVECFSATPKTFQKYILRSQAGGNAMTMKNLITKLPANDTPIKGLYRVGDTTFAAQGWPGVMLGVRNLARLLHV